VKRDSVLCAVVLLSLGMVAWSQDMNEVRVGANDRAQARQSKNVFHRAQPANTVRGTASRRQEEVLTLRSAPAPKASDASSNRSGVRYPGDLTFQGGTVVDSAESHAIYLLPNGKCPISQCWGNPEGFLRDLAESRFIHLVDQYIGLRASERYTLGDRAKISYTPPTVPFTDADVQTFVHAVASAAGENGYGHIFHVFLPPGQDECFDSTFTVCYSPDNVNTFAFCAYHGSVDFPDIGHVLYSVEPFQDVPGCRVRPGTPNGQLVDSTNDVLSHELFETITDPDGTGWWNSTGLGMLGQEIGDECVFVIASFDSDPFIYKIDDHSYATQPEYSNAVHGCAVH
jgi:hypothetical protein